MKKILALLLLLLALGAAWFSGLIKPGQPGDQLEEGYHALYDGESLAGWRVIGGKATFEADGDSIVGRKGPGLNTFLRTEKTYADFSLKMQMRWDEPGNSGVLFRAGQRGGDGRAYGYQYELDPSERSWSGGIYDEKRRGWLANLEDKPEVRAAIRLDDWNDIHIEARGDRLKTWINGVPAADIIDGLDAQGFIALQVHAGSVGVMRWRNIRIKELPPQRSQGAKLLSAKDWRAPDGMTLDFSDDAVAGVFGESDAFINSRRQFSDVLLHMTVPACDVPTVIRLRDDPDDEGTGDSFAEVKIYADRAEARLVTPGGEQQLDTVDLVEAREHRFTGVTSGDRMTLTVDEVDVLRVDASGLPKRGRLRISPARCDRAFRITGLEWYKLGESSGSQVYQTLDTQPAPVLSPQEALSAFSVAPGFEVELVAAEPLVEDPVAMAWDEYGRLYVVELRGYMRDAYGTGSDAPMGQVVRLEDKDGDGRMDSSEVFLGGLVSARAVAVVNEGVLVAEPPNLWLCELPSRDALCENKRRIGDYAVDVESNVEHMENGLHQGLDNWLYNAKSQRSLRIDNGELVERQGPPRGQWGITTDDYGRVLYNHNSTWLQADFFACEDLVLPGRQGPYAGIGVNLTDTASVYSVRVNPGVNRAYIEGTLRDDGRLDTATGVSGLVAYRGDQFPEGLRGNVFVPEVAANVVAQFAMEEEGIALTATQQLYDDERWGQRDFLGSTDERFRPVDAMNGPDGALYIIDMYRGIVQDDHFLTEELREQIFQRELDSPVGMGRIWRVRHTAGKAARGFPGLAGASGVELVAALQHPNGWVRDTAQRLLLGREGDYRSALADVAKGEHTAPALHAIWTLAGRAELQRELALDLAASGDLHRQVQALRAGRKLLQSSDLLALRAQWGDVVPTALGMQWVFALADHNQEAAVRTALGDELDKGLESPYMRQAVVRATVGRELEFLQEYLGGDLQDSEGARTALRSLSYSAYRSLRVDLSDPGNASPELLALLALAESRRDADSWQQIALLEGMKQVAVSRGFVPVRFEAPPAIFSDDSISEESPLWAARLAARRAFTWPGDEIALGLKPLTPSQLKTVQAGQAFYSRCAACHGDAGQGVSGLAPPLAGANWVTGPPEWLARIILQGMSGPVEVLGERFDGVMPPHGHMPELDDATLAGLMTYMRRSWGNRADPVTVDAVKAIRIASAERDTPWTAEELEAVPYDRGYGRFAGDYKISFVTLSITEQTDGLYISVPMYGGGRMEQVNETTFRVEAGGEKVRIEFIVGEDGSVASLVMHRKGEKIPVTRKQ